jgi:hypothetical protein
VPKLISEALGVSADALEELGAFNGFIDLDSKLYVDPFLLRSVVTPELKASNARFEDYFRIIYQLLRVADGPGHVAFRRATRMLSFKETPAAALGYASAGTGGSGIGKGLARRLAITAKQIIDAGLKDLEVFHLLGLLEESVGPDRISDMTIRIILPDLHAFSSRIAETVGAPTRPQALDGTVFHLPFDEEYHQTLVLIPAELLRSLPVAKDWSDIDVVCAHNAVVRERVNHKIGETWRHATQRTKKEDLRDALLENPEALRDLIQRYKGKSAEAYDLTKDPEGHVVWRKLGRQAASAFPLSLGAVDLSSRRAVLDVVRMICNQFRELVEVNGLNEVLWGDDGKRRHERFAQLLFFAVADSYCRANDLDLSREPNAGRGPVDFKVSRGSEIKVTVEVKYTSNTSLKRGFERQLPEYHRAERASDAIYLVIRDTEQVKALEAVLQMREEALSQDQEAPEVIVIDGRQKPSASNM